MKKNKDLFHPLEMSFCGHSGSGKTTLLTKLIGLFSKKFKVGYIKHDAHHFEMDQKGKDTFLAAEAGAHQIAISSPQKMAILTNDCEDSFALRQRFLDSDFVFVEGYKHSLCHKILMWTGGHEDQALLEKYLKEGDQLLAIVGEALESPCSEVPYFHRDDIEEIYSFIHEYFEKKVAKRPLLGLVLGGGLSSRMGKDKGTLSYHGQSQVEHLYSLLDPFTDQTYVSCRADQIHQDHIRPFPTIEDRYLNFGPTGGILSAFLKNPDAAWLVVACDMPLLNESSIRNLIEKRNPYKLATCYFNNEKKWPEPLCAIYEPKASLKLGTYLAMGRPCPRKILFNSRVECLEPYDQSILKNVNTLKDFEKMKSSLTGKIL